MSLCESAEACMRALLFENVSRLSSSSFPLPLPLSFYDSLILFAAAST